MVTLVMMIVMIMKSLDGGTMVMLVIMMMMMTMMILIEEMKGIRFWTDVLRDHRWNYCPIPTQLKMKSREKDGFTLQE